MSAARLGVVLDGVTLSEDEARALWQRFSAHMEAHKGDLEGFAKVEGFASVHPEPREGRACLVISRHAPQRAYGVPVPPRSGGGSPKSQGRDKGRGARPSRGAKKPA